jgi:hypothetical protein
MNCMPRKLNTEDEVKSLIKDVFDHGFCSVPKDHLLRIAGHGNFSKAMRDRLGQILPDTVAYVIEGRQIYFVDFDKLTFPAHDVGKPEQEVER